MIKGKKILAIIPARKASKRLKDKNIKKILGKPLIVLAIEQAKKSRYLDKIIVDTDGEKIREIARKHGAEVPFLRPKELAKDNSSVIETILHCLSWLEDRNEHYDILVLLQVTSPLRDYKDIDKSLELFMNNFDKADSLVAVGEVHLENPYIMERVENGYLKPLIKNDRNNYLYPSQKLPGVYFPYGVMYLSKVDTMKKDKTFYQERTIPYITKRWQNYEIDDLYDFLCVESILKYRLKEKVK